MKPTDHELEQWANVQRRLYHAGRLSPVKIKSLEEIKGWTWDIQKSPTSREPLMTVREMIRAEYKNNDPASDYWFKGYMNYRDPSGPTADQLAADRREYQTDYDSLLDSQLDENGIVKCDENDHYYLMWDLGNGMELFSELDYDTLTTAFPACMTDNYLRDAITAEFQRLGVASVRNQTMALDAVSVEDGIVLIADSTEKGWCDGVQFLARLKELKPRETKWKNGDRVDDGSWGDCWEAYQRSDPTNIPEEQEA